MVPLFSSVPPASGTQSTLAFGKMNAKQESNGQKRTNDRLLVDAALCCFYAGTATKIPQRITKTATLETPGERWGGLCALETVQPQGAEEECRACKDSHPLQSDSVTVVLLCHRDEIPPTPGRCQMKIGSHPNSYRCFPPARFRLSRRMKSFISGEVR
jgi:hypothetical protein